MTNNPHEQHRERLRKMFLYCNPQKMPDHMLLEFLLCYAIPRTDTNPIAHRLINRFGSIENALDADVEELQKVEGVGESAALLLKMIPLFCHRYASNKLKQRTDFQSIDRAADFFKDYYISKNKEMVCALLLDNAHRLICNVELYEGAVNSSNVNTRKLAQIALSYNAAELILAHNHPSGDPTPSDADLYTTKHLMKAFSAIDLNLRAHLIIAGNRYVDVVQTVYDNAKYEVKYMAFRADDLPTVFLDEDELPAREESAPEGSRETGAEINSAKAEDKEIGKTVLLSEHPLGQGAEQPLNRARQSTREGGKERADIQKSPSKSRSKGTRSPAKSETKSKGASKKTAKVSTPKKQAGKTADASTSTEQISIPEAIRLLEQGG